MNKSVSVRVVGSNTIHEGTVKESCPAVYPVIVRKTSTWDVKPVGASKSALTPLAEVGET